MSSCSIYEIQSRIAGGDPGTVAALLSYDSACLRSDTPALGASSFDFETINSRTGVLSINMTNAKSTCGIIAQGIPSTDKIFCSAVVIEPGRIMTARHCFINGQSEWRDISACLPQGAVEFATLKDPETRHVIASVHGVSEVLKRTNVGDDFMVLDLKTPVSGVTGQVAQTAPTPFGEAVIFSYHDLVTPAGATTLPRWRQKARWSLPSCSFTQVKNACALTKCQSIEMYSGAPVWALDEAGATSLAGIQVQGGGAGLAACATPGSATIPSVYDTNLSIRGYAK
ncbi:hypothetical protein HOC_11818 [Hyphomonas oceanitis SCH89]|uniref:Peptidase S1 domain-containing protein n=1 Tax=Hyphomonas oceanitis SCH89 TaxID=1280953 RepID=A0A059G692_9PROT|nr:hypothetical protein HOC_11818 [Hyphomonas oceanitis SCH89]